MICALGGRNYLTEYKLKVIDMFEKFKCWLGIHKSDRDYGMRGLGGDVISHCERCDATITHRKMKWFGGGN